MWPENHKIKTTHILAIFLALEVLIFLPSYTWVVKQPQALEGEEEATSTSESIEVVEQTLEEATSTPEVATSTIEALVPSSTIFTELNFASSTEETVVPALPYMDLGSDKYKFFLPGDLQNNPIVLERKIGRNEPDLKMEILGAATSTQISRSTDQISYLDAFPSTDFVYELSPKGLKESIILKSPDHPDKFEYTMNLNDYDVAQVSPNVIEIYKKGYKNNPLYKIYTIKAPEMVDSAGNKSEDVRLEVQGDSLTLTPDTDWLKVASYPVVVDPTIEITVLTVVSHPVAGENWNIEFATVGTADLAVTPADQATVDDMQFNSLTCDGNNFIPQILGNGVVSYHSWTCDGVGEISFLDLNTGHHHMIFDFGGAIADAYNGAVVWDGGAHTNSWEDAQNWDTNVVPTQADDVLIDLATTTNLAAGTTVKSLTLGVSGGGIASVLNFNYDGLSESLATTTAFNIKNNLIIYSGAKITHTAGTASVVGRTNVWVGGTALVAGTIDVDSKGYSANNGTGVGTGSSNGGGGSYGGSGGKASGSGAGYGGVTYGSTTAPIDLGSGGANAGGIAGPGGGAIKLFVIGSTTISGTISARGQATVGADIGLTGGAGSGGSIFISTPILNGSGTLAAYGGNGACGSFCVSTGGGGGGGRIAIRYTTDNSAFTYSHYGGTGGSGYGSSGSFFKIATSTQGYGNLTFDNNNQGGSTETSFASSSLDVMVVDLLTIKNSAALFLTSSATASTLTLSNNGMYDARDGTTFNNSSTLNWSGFIYDSGGFLNVLSENQNLTVPAGSKLVFDVATTSSNVTRTYNNLTVNGTLSHAPNSSATGATTLLYKLNWQVNGDLTIGAAGTINVDGKGYPASEGLAPGTDGGSVGAGGASYGGVGTTSSSGTYAGGGTGYGSLTLPTHLGSGGGNSNNAGGAGGGAVILNVTGASAISGSITAAGVAGTCSDITMGNSGGGSGGTVSLTTGTLSGSGSISVAGGNGTYAGIGGACINQEGSGGGGGGRAAIYYTTDSSSLTYSIYGGPTGNISTLNAGSGTLFKKSAAQTYGDLILDNNSNGGVTTSSFGTTYVSNQLNFDNFTLQNSAYLNATSSLTYNIFGNFIWNNAFASTTYVSGLQFSNTSNKTLTQSGSLGINVPLIVNSSATTTLSSTLNASSTLTITAGGFNANSNNVGVGGLLTINGGAYSAGSGINNFYSGLTQSAGAFIGGSGTVNITGSLNLSGGNFNPAGTTNITGNLNNTGGTFSASSGTVALTGGDQTIVGANTFYNFTKSVTAAHTLTFPASTLQTILHTMTLSGASSNLLSLRSSTNGVQWSIDPQNTRTISYLDVKDSLNSNTAFINAVGTNSTNSLNNTNWLFTAPNLTQSDYEWYQNVDSLSLTTPVSLQNNSASLTSVSSPLRLRMNLLVGNTQSLPSGYQNFRLQVATNVGGTWADVGTPIGVAWYDLNWQYRRKITFNNSSSGSNLINFPVVINLNATSTSNVDYTKIKTAGADVRFTDADGTTLLSYEIEKWDTTATSTVWVKVPQIDSGSATDFIYMYYGNTAATDAQSAAAVWSGTADTVLHLGETGSGTTITDSTVNASTGSKVASGRPAATTAGLADGAQSFNPATFDYINFGDINNFSTGITLSAWIKTSSASTMGVVAKWMGTSGNSDLGQSYGMYMVSGKLRVVYNGSDAADQDMTAGSTSLNNGNWHYVVATFDPAGGSNNAKNYVDGVVEVQNTLTHGLAIRHDTLDVGAITRSLENDYFSGTIDEVRIASTTKSVDWILADYKNGIGTFSSYASEQALLSAAWQFYNNPSVLSSTTLATTLLSTSNVAESYQEGNPAILTPNAVPSNQYAEWDWSLDPANAAISTPYYFRMTLFDGTPLDTYTNYPSATYIADTAPNSPTSLGGATVVNGSTINTNTPTFSFTLTDADIADTVKYQIQVSTLSSFLSPIIDFLSGLFSQGTQSFTVGQAAGSGTYTTGSSGQTLPDSSSGYYWRVLAIDNSGAFSAWSTANSGATAFNVDTSVSPPSPGSRPPGTRHPPVVTPTPPVTPSPVPVTPTTSPPPFCTQITIIKRDAYAKAQSAYNTAVLNAKNVYIQSITLADSTYTTATQSFLATKNTAYAAAASSLNTAQSQNNTVLADAQNSYQLAVDAANKLTGNKKTTALKKASDTLATDFASAQKALDKARSKAANDQASALKSYDQDMAKALADKTKAYTDAKNVLDAAIKVADTTLNNAIKAADSVYTSALKTCVKENPPLPLIVIPPISTTTPEQIEQEVASTTSPYNSGGGGGGGPLTGLIPITPDILEKLAIFFTFLAIPLKLFLSYFSNFAYSPIVISSWSDVYILFLRSWFGLLSLLGLRKKREYWGTVYDSQSKQPLDPAVVELTDTLTGKTIEQAITDIAGRYGFLLRPGQFTVKAGKTHYAFPSTRIMGEVDEVFTNIYRGEPIVIQSTADVFASNIPMDPVGVDWNQEEKKRLNIAVIHPTLEKFMMVCVNTLFTIGFFFALLSAVATPDIPILICLFSYIVVAIINFLTPPQRLWGRVYGNKNFIAGNYVLLELAYENMDTTIAKSHSAPNGRFFLKAFPGEYVLNISEESSGQKRLLKSMKVKVGKEGVVNDDIKI